MLQCKHVTDDSTMYHLWNFEPTQSMMTQTLSEYSSEFQSESELWEYC